MATIGNLFVNVGASTAGLQKGLADAKKSVGNFNSEIKGSLSKTTFGAGMVAGLVAIGAIFKKIGGDSAGMKKALDGIAKMESKLADEGKKAASATALLADSKKFNKFQDSLKNSQKGIDAIGAKAEIARAKVAAMAKENVNTRFKSSPKAIESAQKQLGGLEASKNKMQAAQDLRAASAPRLASGLAERGATFTKGGAIKLSPIDASAKKSSSAVEMLKGKIGDATKGLEKFNPMSVLSAGGMMGIAGAAIAAVAGATALTIGMMKNADALADQASALGMSATALQHQRDLMGILGVNAQAAEGAMVKMGSSIQNAIDSGDTANFDKLGLSAAALAEVPPNEAFNQMLEKIRGLGTQSEKIDALRDNFGKGGGSLLAAVNATSEALADANGFASKLELPEGMVQKLAASNDKFDAMMRSVENLGMIFAAEFAPFIDDISTAIFEMSTTDNSELLESLTAVADVCKVIAEIFYVIGRAIQVVWNLLQAIVGGALALMVNGFANMMDAANWLVWAFNKLTGLGGDFSKGLDDAVKNARALRDELAKGAVKDLGEAGVASGIMSADKKPKNAPAPKPPPTVATPPALKLDKGKAKILDSVEKEMANMREKLANIGASEFEQQINRINKLAKGVDVSAAIAEIKKLNTQMEAKQAVADSNKALKESSAELQKMKLGAVGYATAMAVAAGFDKDVVATLTENAKQMEKISAESKGMGDWTDFTAGLNEELAKTTSSREDQLRAMAKAAGKLGTDLDNAVANALKMENSIAESNKLKAQQEDSIKTIESMTIELEKKTLGDKAFARKEFAKGVTDPKQLAEFDRLQAAIDAATPAKDKTEKADKQKQDVGSISTVFGDFKFASGVNEKILSENQRQTKALETMAAATVPAVTGGNTGTGLESMKAAAVDDGGKNKFDPQMETQIKLLQLIAANTAGTLT